MLDDKLRILLQEYVDRHLNEVYSVSFHSPMTISRRAYGSESNDELKKFISTTRQPTFSQVLLTLIDKKGTQDSDIYKKADIDRRHFSKIRSNPQYRPRKTTVIALAFALELTKKEADKLLRSAGYTLSDSDTFDLVIQFCFEHAVYDLPTINQALDSYSLKPLAGVME
jgi:hypothetical protein